MRSILAAALLLSVASPPCRAQPEPDLRAPASDELAFLAANCPSAHLVRAGTVAAYGEVYKAPLLVSSDLGRVFIDGVQVFPRPLARSDFQVQKRAARLHSRFYLDERERAQAASERVEKRLSEWKAERAIDDYKVWKRHGKLAAFMIEAGGVQARAYLDTPPAPLIQKDRFLVAALFAEYPSKAAAGKDRAREWLKARLEELKAAGTIDRLQWEPERESAKIRFAGERDARDYSFGEDKSPFGAAYAKHWKARQGEIAAAAGKIVGRLEAGGILLYSFSFEAALPADPGAVRALEAIRAGKASAPDLAEARARLKLSGEQVRVLAEELR